MLYTLEERLEIGRRIYQNEISRYEASFEYGISQNTARDYMRLYRDRNNLPSKRGTSKKTLPAPYLIGFPRVPGEKPAQGAGKGAYASSQTVLTFAMLSIARNL